MFRTWIELRRLRRESAPSPAFKAALLSRTIGTPAPRLAFRFAAVGACVVVLLFGTGTGVFAYESPSVVEGHPLHFVKRTIEETERRFAASPEARAEYHARMLERRMGEAERMADMEASARALLEDASVELDSSLVEMEGDATWGDAEIRRGMQERLLRQHERYERAFDRVRDPRLPRPLPPPAEFRARLNAVGQ